MKMEDRPPTLQDHFHPPSGRVLIEPVKPNRTFEERLAHDEGVATSLYELCLLSMQTVLGLRDVILEQEQSERLNEVAVDLRLWGGITKTSKFEQCLASCTDIQRDVISLLRDTGKCMQMLITLQKPTNSDELLKELLTDLSILIEKAEVMLDTDNDEAAATLSEDNKDENDGLLLDKVTEMVDELSSNVELLAELIPTLEQTYAVMKVQPVLSQPDPAMISFRVSNEALPYVSQVCDKFPKATLELVERLGEANWQRFRRLRLQNEEPPTMMESSFKPASIFRDSGVGSSLGTRLTGSQRPIEHISSNESFASSARSDHIHRQRVPPEPSEVAEGKPFTCRFCNQTQKYIRNRNDWKFHVFQDLRPYICTFENCPQMLSMFSHRKAWAQHEIECHLQTIEYRCLTCGLTFQNEHELIRHHEQHTEFSKTEYVDWKTVRCQLCHDQSFGTSREYTNHVAKHMEEVALVVIPQDENSDSDSDESSKSEFDFTTRQHGQPLASGVSPDTTGAHQCSGCSEHFSTEVALKAHVQINRCDQEVTTDSVADPSLPYPTNLRDYILDLADPTRPQQISANISSTRVPKQPALFQCSLCPKRFTRPYNLRSHLRTHTDERPFVCTVCGKAYARQHDRTRHESLHSAEKKFICKGNLDHSPGLTWGCGRRFARADALGRHFRSEAGRICIQPLLDEEAAVKAQKGSTEQLVSSNAPVAWSPPEALLTQYPALQNIDWNGLDIDAEQFTSEGHDYTLLKAGANPPLFEHTSNTTD